MIFMPPIRDGLSSFLQRLLPFLLALVLPVSAGAFTLGRLTLYSFLGEPLRATINVKLSSGEDIDQCHFSLPADAVTDNFMSYLYNARITLARKGKQTLLNVTTRQRINDPAFKMPLKANCGSQGIFTRLYAVLLDPPDTRRFRAPLPVVATALVQKKHRTMHPPKIKRLPAQWTIQPGETLSGIAHAIFPWNTRKQKILLGKIVAANPSKINPSQLGKILSGEILHIPALTAADLAPPTRPRPAATSHKTARTSAPVSPPAPTQRADHLELTSAAPSTSDRSTAQPSLKIVTTALVQSADDQTASILALTRQVKQLEAQVGALQRHLATRNTGQPARLLNKTTPQPQPTRDTLTLVAVALLALVVGALSSFAALRYGKRFRSHPIEPITTGTASFPPESITRPSVGDDTAKKDKVIGGKSVPPFASKDAISVSYVGSLLDEAKVYLAGGLPQKAADHLKQHLEDSPSDTKPWLMLLEIYVEQARTTDFVALANRFHRQFGDTADWTAIQAMERHLNTAHNQLLEDGQPAPQEITKKTVPAEIPTESTATHLPKSSEKDHGTRHEESLTQENGGNVQIPPEGNTIEIDEINIELPQILATESVAEENSPAVTTEPEISLMDIPLEFTLPEQPTETGLSSVEETPLTQPDGGEQEEPMSAQRRDKDAPA